MTPGFSRPSHFLFQSWNRSSRLWECTHSFIHCPLSTSWEMPGPEEAVVNWTLPLSLRSSWFCSVTVLTRTSERIPGPQMPEPREPFSCHLTEAMEARLPPNSTPTPSSSSIAREPPPETWTLDQNLLFPSPSTPTELMMAPVPLITNLGPFPLSQGDPPHSSSLT